MVEIEVDNVYNYTLRRTIMKTPKSRQKCIKHCKTPCRSLIKKSTIKMKEKGHQGEHGAVYHFGAYPQCTIGHGQ